MLDGAVDLVRDRKLVERCQRGEEAAFAELYQRYQQRLHRFCLRRLHASDDAEEAVQEAFARAWRALPRFVGERRFYPWLTVIAGNVCTDMLRRRSRVVPMGEVPGGHVGAGDPELDEQLLRQVDLAIANEALTHLSDRHQRVLRLREGTEWSTQRIAEHEGLAAPAVDALLWRARQAFKREFAALSETGGMAAILGIAALRRSLGRFAERLSSVLGPVASAPRGPGTIAATVAITGAAVAGGGVALVGQGLSHPAPDAAVGAPASPPTAAPASPPTGAPVSPPTAAPVSPPDSDPADPSTGTTGTTGTTSDGNGPNVVGVGTPSLKGTQGLARVTASLKGAWQWAEGTHFGNTAPTGLWGQARVTASREGAWQWAEGTNFGNTGSGDHPTLASGTGGMTTSGTGPQFGTAPSGPDQLVGSNQATSSSGAPAAGGAGDSTPTTAASTRTQTARGQWQSGPDAQGQGQAQWQSGPDAQGQGQAQWQAPARADAQGQGQAQWQSGPDAQGPGQAQWQSGPDAQGQGQAQWQAPARADAQGQGQGQGQAPPQWQGPGQELSPNGVGAPHGPGALGPWQSGGG